MLTNPYGKIIGYVRVSTDQQNLDRQIQALLDYGVDKDSIYAEKESCKNFNRPVYKKMIRILRRGDILVIKSIDRLGRNYQDIIDQWRMITQDIECGIHVIDMPLLNTSGDPEDLLSRFITDMMLQVLSFVAENERETTLKWQKEGLEAARKRGDVVFGRPRVKIPVEFWEVYLLWKSGRVKVKDVQQYAKEKFGICNRTFYRRIRELDAQFGYYSMDQLQNMSLAEYKDGFDYIVEQKEAALGEFNPYVNNPEKERIARERRKEYAEEQKRLMQETDENELRKLIQDKRIAEFNKRFNIDLNKSDGHVRGVTPPKPIDPDLISDVVKTIIIK